MKSVTGLHGRASKRADSRLVQERVERQVELCPPRFAVDDHRLEATAFDELPQHPGLLVV